MTTTRWRRFGHDRLYVKTADDELVGWFDVLSGAAVLQQPDLRSAFDRAVDDYLADKGLAHKALVNSEPADGYLADGYLADSDLADKGLAHKALADRGLGDRGPARPASAVPGPSDPTPRSTRDAPERRPAAHIEPFAVRVDFTDLAVRGAGQAARAQALAERRAAPWRSVARLLKVHTSERAWRIGADGEAAVGRRLAGLPPAWSVLHAVPVGQRGADIDHVVVGPAGVFTINTKHHPDARVWVGGNTFMVNGHRQPYVRHSRHEAARAARLLTAAAGFPVAVRAVLAVVGASAGFVVKAQPDDVHVVTRQRLVRWLLQQPEAVDGEALAAIVRAARRSTTWR